MAKVCLIYPRDLNLDFFPLGIGYVASSLIKNNHDVTLLDIKENDIPLLDRLRELKPDIVGISITTPQLKLARMAVNRIRQVISGVPIVAGGIHPSYFKSIFLSEFDIDYVIYGEGEVTMCQLCEAIKSDSYSLASINGLIFKDKNGKIIVNPPRDLIKDLNSIPFPARQLVNYQTYLQPPGLIRGIWTNKCGNITTSRGCPGRCTFCGVNYLYGNTYRRRSVENVLEEIDLMVSEYVIDGLYFMDDTFLMDTKWVEEFTEKFIARKYNLKWSCYGRVDTVNEKMLKAIKKAGCVQTEYGIESCSESVLKCIKKRTSFEQIAKAVKMTKDNGLRALGSFIFGFPDDSEEDLAQTIALAAKVKLDFLTCYIATPYPGSELYEQAVKENRVLEPDMSNWYVRNSGIWKVNLDEKTILKYRNILLKSYRYRNTLFFLKNPVFLLKLCGFMLKNYKALFKSLSLAIKEKCFDDLGYYFYISLPENSSNRNRI